MRFFDGGARSERVIEGGRVQFNILISIRRKNTSQILKKYVAEITDYVRSIY